MLLSLGGAAPAVQGRVGARRPGRGRPPIPIQILRMVGVPECPGEQRSGLFWNRPVLWAPCDCYDEVFIPLGLIKNLLRPIARRFANKTIKQLAKTTLGTLGRKTGIDTLKRTLTLERFKLREYVSKIRQATEDIQTWKARISQINLNMPTLKQTKASLSRSMKE